MKNTEDCHKESKSFRSLISLLCLLLDRRHHECRWSLCSPVIQQSLGLPWILSVLAVQSRRTTSLLFHGISKSERSTHASLYALFSFDTFVSLVATLTFRTHSTFVALNDHIDIPSICWWHVLFDRLDHEYPCDHEDPFYLVDPNQSLLAMFHQDRRLGRSFFCTYDESLFSLQSFGASVTLQPCLAFVTHTTN